MVAPLNGLNELQCLVLCAQGLGLPVGNENLNELQILRIIAGSPTYENAPLNGLNELQCLVLWAKGIGLNVGSYGLNELQILRLIAGYSLNPTAPPPLNGLNELDCLKIIAGNIQTLSGNPYTTGLFLDLDGDKASVTGAKPTIGDSVAAWFDASGNGHAALQPTMPAQPTVAAGTNGHLGVLFDGVNDSMDMPNMSALTQAQMFIVFSNTTPGIGNTIYLLAAAADSPTTYLPFSGDHNLYDCFFSTTRKGGFGSGLMSSGYNLYDVSSAPGEWSATVNGTGVLNSSPNTVSAPSIGTIGNGGGAWAGTIQRLLIYSTPPPTSNAAAIRAYLKSLYGTP